LWRRYDKSTDPRQTEIKVRIAFIDAPEKGQAFDQRAKQAMSELVFGKDVVLQPYTIERSGYLVAPVFSDGQDAGLELLNQGLCWVYEKYVGEAVTEIQTSYWAAQAAAQIGSASGKTLIQCPRGSGERAKRHAPGVAQDVL
jgi:endonuclease YncB( thermonuclease family)